MNNRIRINAKSVKPIIQATFPDYRRREVTIVVTDTVTFHDLNWFEGSRSEYRACTIFGKPIESKYDLGGPAPWANPFEGKTVALPPAAVIVRGGVTCGKPAMLTINVHPDNVPKLIPETV